jgi:large subunit ribosomal protein L25
LNILARNRVDSVWFKPLNIGVSPSGKAAVFGIAMRRFESFHPKQLLADEECKTSKASAALIKGIYQEKRRHTRVSKTLYFFFFPPFFSCYLSIQFIVHGEHMEVAIDIVERKKISKSANQALRRADQIPAVIYAKGKENQNIALQNTAMQEVLRSLEMGFLATTVFLLKDSSGKTRKAIIREIQYEPTTYKVRHIDFLELVADHVVEVKVPLQCTGEAECVGVKAGGYIRRVKEFIPVRCLPKDIPSHFEVDMKEVDMRQSRAVRDLKGVLKGVDVRLPQDQVVASIVK